MKDIPLQPRGRNREILRAAIDLIATEGVGNATIKSLCERAGVTPPAIYYHYGNKDGLVGAVVEDAARRWLDGLMAAVRTGGSLPEHIQSAVEIWRQEILDPQSPIKLLMRIQLERARIPPLLRESLGKVMAHGRGVIAEIIVAAAGPLESPEDLARTVIALVQGAALQHDLDEDDEALAERLVEIGQTLMTLIEHRRLGPDDRGDDGLTEATRR
jgi:AcrR family transcriptional regulator